MKTRRRLSASVNAWARACETSGAHNADANAQTPRARATDANRGWSRSKLGRPFIRASERRRAAPATLTTLTKDTPTPGMRTKKVTVVKTARPAARSATVVATNRTAITAATAIVGETVASAPIGIASPATSPAATCSRVTLVERVSTSARRGLTRDRPPRPGPTGVAGDRTRQPCPVEACAAPADDD